MKHETFALLNSVPLRGVKFAVHSKDGAIFHPDRPCRDLCYQLERMLKNLPQEAPIVVSIHGRGSRPFERSSGLHVDFIWDDRKNMITPRANIWDLYERAGREAAPLGALLNILGQVAPDRKLEIRCHGLGARIALQSVKHLKQSNIGRIIITDGLEFATSVLLILNHHRAKAIEFQNITTGEHAFRERLFARFGPKMGDADIPIFMGFPFPRKNWTEVETSAATAYSSVETSPVPIRRIQRGKFALPAMRSVRPIGLRFTFRQNQSDTIHN